MMGGGKRIESLQVKFWIKFSYNFVKYQMFGRTKSNLIKDLRVYIKFPLLYKIMRTLTSRLEYHR